MPRSLNTHAAALLVTLTSSCSSPCREPDVGTERTIYAQRIGLVPSRRLRNADRISMDSCLYAASLGVPCSTAYNQSFLSGMTSFLVPSFVMM